MPDSNNSMNLIRWVSGSDRFNHSELAANFLTIAGHTHTGDPDGNQIPTGGLEDGAVTSAKLAPLSAWTNPTLAGSWVSTGAPYATAGYFKDLLGIVYLAGRVQGGSGTIFTLPAGFRPAATLAFATVGNNAFAQVTLTNTGVLALVTGAGPISLDNIRFRAEA